MRRSAAFFAGAIMFGSPACTAMPDAPAASSMATGDPRQISSAPIDPPVCVTIASQGASPRDETGGSRLDTSRIQAGLSRCGPGRAVRLTGGDFLSGPLVLPSGVSLIIDRGATLYASRQAAVYDDVKKPESAHCGQYDRAGKSCRPLITLGPNGEGGGVYGLGAIDGQGGRPIIYSANWGPPPVCGSLSMPPGFPLNAMTWWDLSNCVDVVNMKKLSDTTVNQSNPVLIRASGRNLTFAGITLQNSPKAHLQTSDSSNVTIWGIKINTPSDYAPYGMPRAHNTDGIDGINASNVTIAYSYINAGDDHIAIGAKAGSPVGPSANITIMHDHLYGGHGVSIGSLVSGGVRNVLVDDVVIDGGSNMAAMNGVHIKSGGQGGTVENVTYRNICIRNARNSILLETTYGHKAGGQDVIYRNIVFDDVAIFNDVPKSGRIVIDGSGTSTPIQATLRDVVIDNPEAANASLSRNASINLVGKQSFMPKGQGVAVSSGGTQLDARATPLADCRAALAQAAPFAISVQRNPKTAE